MTTDATDGRRDPPTLLNANLGVRLSFLAGQLGGQEKAAAIAGVSFAQFKRYIKGDNQPTFAAMVALAKGSNVSLDWLATGDGPIRPDPQATPGPATPTGQINFTPALETIIGNAVAGMEHWRRRDGLSISPELEGRLTAHICSILVRRLNWCVEHGEAPPDYLVTEQPYDFIANMENDPNPEAIELAAMFRAMARRAR